MLMTISSSKEGIDIIFHGLAIEMCKIHPCTFLSKQQGAGDCISVIVPNTL